MKKTLVMALLLASSMGANAQRHVMTHFLVAQWWDNGSQMCRYDNGTVLNMGARVCPLSIKG